MQYFLTPRTIQPFTKNVFITLLYPTQTIKDGGDLEEHFNPQDGMGSEKI